MTNSICYNAVILKAERFLVEPLDHELLSVKDCDIADSVQTILALGMETLNLRSLPRTHDWPSFH